VGGGRHVPDARRMRVSRRQAGARQQLAAPTPRAVGSSSQVDSESRPLARLFASFRHAHAGSKSEKSCYIRRRPRSQEVVQSQRHHTSAPPRPEPAPRLIRSARAATTPPHGARGWKLVTSSQIAARRFSFVAVAWDEQMRQSSVLVRDGTRDSTHRLEVKLEARQRQRLGARLVLCSSGEARGSAWMMQGEGDIRGAPGSWYGCR
jgi:hypothetical protein